MATGHARALWSDVHVGVLLAFNDQVLPRANHQAQDAPGRHAQTKPKFSLKPQVINAIAGGKFYLKAGGSIRRTASCARS